MLVRVSAGLPLCDTRRLISSRVQSSDPSWVDVVSTPLTLYLQPSLSEQFRRNTELMGRSKTDASQEIRQPRAGDSLDRPEIYRFVASVAIPDNVVVWERSRLRLQGAITKLPDSGIYRTGPPSPPWVPGSGRAPASSPCCTPLRARMIPLFASSSSALSSARSPLRTLRSM
jgi:hypothetical protein